MSKEIKAIVFDLGNTLVDIDYKLFLVNTGLDGKFNELEIFNILTESTQKYEKGEIYSKFFYSIVTKELNLAITFEKFALSWCSVATDFVIGMDDLIQKLNLKYPLYLLSNTNELHFDYILKKFSQLKYFNKYFLSYKIGTMKPDVEIYKYMLKNIPFKASEILFIDDKEINIESAKLLGIDAVYFASSHDLINSLKMKNILE
jgi:putative hydrolase of the HAD superfamily